MVFQVAIAFACGLFEGAAYKDPNAVVLGHSGIAVWMMLCGRLMPNAPLKSAITAILCVLMWPLGYWVDLQIYGYQPMPLDTHAGVGASAGRSWRSGCTSSTSAIITFYVQQQRAEDMGSYALTDRIGTRRDGRSLARAAQDTGARRRRQTHPPRDPAVQHRRQELLLRKRFEREAQVTASLRSPHTVALYDFGQAKDGAFYYVMELLEGIDLQTLVERFGPMEPARVANILHQVSQSLEEAHRAGLVHRDIKPRNILLGKLGLEYDFAKVLDFGLVKTLARRRPGPHAHHHGRRRHRHAGLSLARSRDGQSGDRRPGGPLQPRLHGVFPADRPAGVRRAHADGIRDRARADAAAADARALRAARSRPGWKRSSCSCWRRIRTTGFRARRSWRGACARCRTSNAGRRNVPSSGGKRICPELARASFARRKQWRRKYGRSGSRLTRALTMPNRSESEQTRRMFLLGAGLILAHQVAGKAVRDGLFLSLFSPADLPEVMAAAALFSVLLGLCFSRLLSRFGPMRMVPAAFAVGALLHVVEFVLLRTAGRRAGRGGHGGLPAPGGLRRDPAERLLERRQRGVRPPRRQAPIRADRRRRDGRRHLRRAAGGTRRGLVRRRIAARCCWPSCTWRPASCCARVAAQESVCGDAGRKPEEPWKAAREAFRQAPFLVNLAVLVLHRDRQRRAAGLSLQERRRGGIRTRARS